MASTLEAFFNRLFWDAARSLEGPVISIMKLKPEFSTCGTEGKEI